MSTKLGVNIDHVATIREARRAPEPDPVQAAVLAELAGAHGITVHLRQDRRHIREQDVELLLKVVKTRLNVEMAATDEMVDLLTGLKPHTCTLVPERPEEVTTTGGLDVRENRDAVGKAVTALHQVGIRVSIFLDPDKKQISTARELGCSVIELNTGRYADLTPADLENAGDDARDAFRIIRETAGYAAEQGMTVLAGHGLTYRNVGPIAEIEEIEELNIGHNIIARAVLVGLDMAVREMLYLLS